MLLKLDQMYFLCTISTIFLILPYIMYVNYRSIQAPFILFLYFPHMCFSTIDTRV